MIEISAIDDLEANPLFRALSTNFKDQFELACKSSCVIAIPQTESLADLRINQFMVDSHILTPSKLLKQHFNAIQDSSFDTIEMNDHELICHERRTSSGSSSSKSCNRTMVVKIIAQEIGYNIHNKEYKMILIEQPLLTSRAKPFMKVILSTLSPRTVMTSRNSQIKIFRSAKVPRNHDDCLRYLESISHEITTELEQDVKILQSKYMILPGYLDDAATRIRNLVQVFTGRYECCVRSFGLLVTECVRRNITMSLENYITHLLHGKIIASIYEELSGHDDKLMSKFEQINRSGLGVIDFGAQPSFADFEPSEDVLSECIKLANLKSPLALVNSLLDLFNHIIKALNGAVQFRMLVDLKSGRVPICSDDLIACLVISLALARPNRLCSVAKYLELFGWTSTARDQAAYYMATFQIVIQYVLNYKPNKKG